MVATKNISKGYDDRSLFGGLNLQVKADEHVAIIDPNDIGKITSLRCLAGDLSVGGDKAKWTGSVDVGYFARDHAGNFVNDMNLFDWVAQWTQDGRQLMRDTLGRMLFSSNEIKKPVRVTSGGEQDRILFSRLILKRPNVLMADEPINHPDMESIEVLNLTLSNCPGTLIFISCDREFISSLVTRIIKLDEDGVADFSGSYDDCLRSQGVTV